jgi:hypothetical protein
VFAADGNGGNINAVHGQKGCFVNCNVWLGFFFFFFNSVFGSFIKLDSLVKDLRLYHVIKKKEGKIAYFNLIVNENLGFINKLLVRIVVILNNC